MSRLRDALLDELSRAALILAKRSIPSRTLRAAIRAERLTERSVRLLVPHYWALYYHDGRGPVLPKRASMIIYYRDPKDDPRLTSGYPVRMSDIKRLTRQQYLAGLLENKLRFRANPGGGTMQFMVVVPSTGPTRPGKSYPFFTKGMEAFPQLARDIIQRAMQLEFRRLNVSEQDVIRLRL